MTINYRKSTVETRVAYFKWKAKCQSEKHSVISFVAGYNAANKGKKAEAALVEVRAALVRSGCLLADKVEALEKAEDALKLVERMWAETIRSFSSDPLGSSAPDALDPERIEKAATRTREGKVYSVDRPGRHDAVLALLYKSEGESPYRERSLQGFITSNGRFVDRIEGAKIAIKAGQIEKLKWPPQLYSEDLW